MVNNWHNITQNVTYLPSPTKKKQPSNASASQQLSSLLLNGTSRKGLSIMNKRAQRLLKMLRWLSAQSNIKAQVRAGTPGRYSIWMSKGLFSMQLIISARQWDFTGRPQPTGKDSGVPSLLRMRVKVFPRQT